MNRFNSIIHKYFIFCVMLCKIRMSQDTIFSGYMQGCKMLREGATNCVKKTSWCTSAKLTQEPIDLCRFRGKQTP